MPPAWRTLCSAAELSLQHTLLNGQCFSWKQLGHQFCSVVAGRVVTLREHNDEVQYSCDAADAAASEVALLDYFQMHTSIAALRKSWSAADAHMAEVAAALPAMRIIRQDPVECLFSFITSSNNNVGRITGLLDKLRTALGTAAGVAEGGVTLYHFPTVDALASVEEQTLRELGFGYRAKYIRTAAQQVQQAGGEEWLLSLRSRPHAEIQKALVNLHGCGLKVADCVALFSLDARGAIPVDTHVFSIAAAHYDPSLRSVKSLTPAIYARVGDIFRAKFGAHGGWAHSLLFAAELPQFRSLLPPAMVERMAQVKREEKAVKAEKKEGVAARRLQKRQTGAAAAAAAGGGAAATAGSPARQKKARAAVGDAVATGSPAREEGGDDEEGRTGSASLPVPGTATKKRKRQVQAR